MASSYATGSSARETNLIPIVMVTAMGRRASPNGRHALGANGYLTKPLQPAQFYETMDAALLARRTPEARDHGEVNFDVRSELTYLSQASDMLADLFAHTPLTDRHIKDLKQAIMEMGGNAIEWGHRKNADLVLRITYRIDPSSITLIITDQGPGFNPRNLPHAASDDDPIGHIEIRNELGLREGGFGIMLARGLVDEFRYNKRGNEVTLVKHFESANNRRVKWRPEAEAWDRSPGCSASLALRARSFAAGRPARPGCRSPRDPAPNCGQPIECHSACRLPCPSSRPPRPRSQAQRGIPSLGPAQAVHRLAEGRRRLGLLHPELAPPASRLFGPQPSERSLRFQPQPARIALVNDDAVHPRGDSRPESAEVPTANGPPWE